MTLRTFSLFLLLVGAAACGSDSSTAPTPPLTSSSQFFSGTVSTSGTSVVTFSTTSQSIINLTLASLVSSANGEVVDGATVLLGFGTPSGSACTTTTTQTVSVSLAAQIRTASVAAGTYCFSVANAGGITGPTTFSARVTATSAAPPESALNGIESFSSSLPLGGTAVHTFEATRGGNSFVTLTTARTDQLLRLSMGLWDGSTCRLTVSADTVAGGTPQLTAGLDAGTYCVSLRDHTAAHQTAFTITIQHP